MADEHTGFWDVLRRPFVLDRRALALLRMATAAVLLLALAIRSPDLEAHYGNLGVLPMQAVLDHLWTPYQFSLHAANGLWQTQALLFALAAGAAGALLAGYHTRLATAASWVLLVSLQNRNPLIGQGGDDLPRMLLFWGLFLPWGRVWAWDARARPAPVRLDYFGAATVAYVVQLALLYWCTALLKSGPERTRDGTALYYAFSLDHVLLPGGRLLYPYSDLLRALTFATYYTELLLPFALFLPVGVARRAAAGGAAALVRLPVPGRPALGHVCAGRVQGRRLVPLRRHHPSGRRLDLNRNGAPLRYAKPPSVVALFKNDRWRKYSENYLFVPNAWMRPYLCNYQLRVWHENPAHAPLRHLSVVYMKEVSLPDYHVSKPVREVLCECEPSPLP